MKVYSEVRNKIFDISNLMNSLPFVNTSCMFYSLLLTHKRLDAIRHDLHFIGSLGLEVHGSYLDWCILASETHEPLCC